MNPQNNKPVQSQNQANLNSIQQQRNPSKANFVPDQLGAYLHARPSGSHNHDLSLLNDQSRAILQNPSNSQDRTDQLAAFLNANNQYQSQNQNYHSMRNHNLNMPNQIMPNPTVRSWNDSMNPNYHFIENLKYDDDEELPSSRFQGELSNQEKTQSVDLDKITHLSIKIKRKILAASSFHEQILPIMVSLGVDEHNSDKRAPLDLICVIDHSGSMSGTKIELVKNTFNYLLRYLNDYDRLSIIIFDNQASRLVPLITTSQKNKEKIFAALRSVQGRGGTDINLGMMHAFQVLNQRRHKNSVTSIFLLSDGLDKGAENKIKDSLTKFKIGQDVTINTFGFGRDHDPELMVNISNLRDGNFYFIDKLDSIDEAFVDCLGGLLSSVGQSAKIKIQTSPSDVLPNISINKAYGDESMWQLENQTYTTNICPVVSSQKKDYVLEIKIPSTTKNLLDHEKNIKIISAEAIITGFDGKETIKKADLSITLLNETEQIQEEEDDDIDVMKHFYRVKGSLVMDEGRKLADRNQYEEAKKTLENFKQEIANSRLKEDTYIKNMIKDIDATIRDINPVVYHTTGRQMIWNNQKAQMQQRSNITMANSNMMPMQQMMNQEVQTLKSKKYS